MNTREQVREVLQPFIDEYQGKQGIWGLSVDAGPAEYNEWGKRRHSEKRDYVDWALHVFTSNQEADIPEYYRGVRIMVFFENYNGNE